MRTPHIIPLLFVAGFCIANAQTNSTTTNQTKWPSIYDESADGSKQIAQALETATKEHKHVLLMFGANWCGWCHKLHTLFETETNIADELKNNYVVAMIDVKSDSSGKIENWHNGFFLKKYSPVYQGVPFIVVLDANGKQLTTQDNGNTGKLEEGDHYNHDKVITFLKEWAPKSNSHARIDVRPPGFQQAADRFKSKAGQERRKEAKTILMLLPQCVTGQTKWNDYETWITYDYSHPSWRLSEEELFRDLGHPSNTDTHTVWYEVGHDTVRNTWKLSIDIHDGYVVGGMIAESEDK